MTPPAKSVEKTLAVPRVGKMKDPFAPPATHFGVLVAQDRASLSVMNAMHSFVPIVAISSQDLVRMAMVGGSVLDVKLKN
jgi:hypothetical protein